MVEEQRSRRPARLLIVDDHDLARAGLRAMLAGERGIEVVAEATSGREAVALIDWAAAKRTSVSLLQSEAPPATAISTRPNCRARAANSIAWSDEAQAEFKARYGPVSPKALETVPAIMLADTSGESAACRGRGRRIVAISSSITASCSAGGNCWKSFTSRRNCAASPMHVP
jgi:CheY-like chemotaxis protein